MAGTPDDWTDWHAAGGRGFADLAPDTPRARTARLHARVLALAARLPAEALADWLALGERMGAEAEPGVARRRAGGN